MMSNIEYETMAILLDPFGAKAFSVATKCWTVSDKNTMTIGLTGMILINRIIWVSVGIIALLVGYRAFSFEEKNVRYRPEIG